MNQRSNRLSRNELLAKPASEMWLKGAEDDEDEDEDLDDEDLDSDDDEDSEDDEDEDEDDDKSDKSKKAKKSETSDPKDRLILRLKADKVKLKERLDNAVKAKTKAEADVIAAKAEKVTDEKTRERLVELESKSAKDDDEIRNLRIKVAFLADTTHKWKKPEAALKLADLSEVEIDDRGRVTGLEDALEDLAESDSYLLATSDTDQDDDDKSDKSAKRPPRKSGDKPGDKGKQTAAQAAAQKKKLQNKYAGLRKGR